MANVYEIITEKIIEQLEKGVVPWRMPCALIDAPKNLVSGKYYRGINHFLLGLSPYESSYWVSYKQAKKLGGQVRKGEKSTLVIFWKWIDDEDEEGESVRYPVCRYYRVFNVEQCDGICHKRLAEEKVELTRQSEFNPIEAAEKIVAEMPNKPTIEYRTGIPCYRPKNDTVYIPEPTAFWGMERFYGTLYHELVHSTASKTRLNRWSTEGPAHFGSDRYGKEELVAEMGAAFLCGAAKIETATLEDSASYIDSWLRVLKAPKNKKMVVTAAAQAQKAADYIRNIQFQDN